MDQPTLCQQRNCFTNVGILKIEITLPPHLKNYTMVNSHSFAFLVYLEEFENQESEILKKITA